MRHQLGFTLTWFKKRSSKHESALSVRCEGRRQLHAEENSHRDFWSVMQPCSIFIIKSLSSPGSCGLAFSSSCTTDPSLLRRTDKTKKKTPSLFLLRSECIIKRPQNGSKVFKVESLRRIFGFISLRTGSSEPASPCKQRFNPHRVQFWDPLHCCVHAWFPLLQFFLSVFELWKCFICISYSFLCLILTFKIFDILAFVFIFLTLLYLQLSSPIQSRSHLKWVKCLQRVQSSGFDSLFCRSVPAGGAALLQSASEGPPTACFHLPSFTKEPV